MSLDMSNESLEELADGNVGTIDEGQGVTRSFKALKLSNTSASGSKACIPLPTKTVELGEHTHDSGYGSATSTPNSKDSGIPLRRPGQIPLIQQSGLCVSSKTMDPETRQRFIEVQLEIEKMLLEVMRKLKSGPGRYNPIAIRPMMLGKTDSDTDARPYMVFICSENIKRKVQDFVDGPLVRSLCEPDDDDVPPFKALVIGHAIRLRASASDISVRCGSMHNFYEGTTTFCGMPIRLCDERGHSRNATFGGMVKVTPTDGEYQLYGLTAGHMIKDHQVVTDEEGTGLNALYGGDTAGLDLGDEVMTRPENHTRTGSPALSDNTDQHFPTGWFFPLQHELGQVLDADRGEALVNKEQSEEKPYLDWALFEVNAHRPNQLAYHGREHSGGDLRLPLSTPDPRNYEIPASMLCASEGVKHGVLSTTRARVLLDPRHSFTDAYTLSLSGSEVSDGDSGSWVVDESRLEVYGHVVADDVFGDAYVIPMIDVLADIQRFFGAESVDLPSGLDMISMASIQRPSLLAGINPRERLLCHFEAGTPEEMTDPPNAGEETSSSVLSEVIGMTPTDFVHCPLPASPSVNLPHQAVSIPPSEAFILDPEHAIRPLYSSHVNPYAPVNVTGTSPHVTHGSEFGSLPGDSGYSSLHATPNTSPPVRTGRQSPSDEDATVSIQGYVEGAFEVADMGEFGSLTYSELVENFQSLFGQSLSVNTVTSLRRMLSEGKKSSDPTEEFADLCEFLGSRQTLFDSLTSRDLNTSLANGISRGMTLGQFSAALSNFRYRLSPEFVKMFYGSCTRNRGTLMNLAEFVESCIKLERMTHMFKDHVTDGDGYIRISFEDCLSMMVKLMD